MKKLALFMTALLVATLSFAGTTTLSKTQRSMTASWRSKSSNGIALKHDINMVYGGEDLAPRHELVTTTVYA